MKRSQAFTESKAETNTQLTKLMYLVAVSKHGRIGMWKLDWKAHDPKSRGVGSEYLTQFWPKILRKAQQVLGHKRPLDIMMDNAPSHNSKLSKGEIQKYFRNIIYQPPSSPDFNMCDAGIFGNMETECNKAGASTIPEIEDAVEACWKKITPEFCSSVVGRIKKNLAQAIELKGGNFYHESRGPEMFNDE